MLVMLQIAANLHQQQVKGSWAKKLKAHRRRLHPAPAAQRQSVAAKLCRLSPHSLSQSQMASSVA